MNKIRLLLLSAILISISWYMLWPSQQVMDSGDKETRSGAWDALQFLSTSAAFPFEDIPEDGYSKAYEHYRSNFENITARVQTMSPWQSIGPVNLGGRTLCIAFHPNDTSTIWLGSASGGLWKSVTGGIGPNAWNYIPTGFPVRGVSTIAINPSNSNEMYIGTGETYTYASAVNGLIHRPTRGSVGIGILKSTDGGATWTHALNWSYNQTRGIWEIIINPLNPDMVYAATTEGIYKSNDAGVTWQQVLNELMVMDMEMDPADTSVLYAGVGNTGSPNKGIYRTTNSGANWTHLTNGLPSGTYHGRTAIRTNPLNHNSVVALIADSFSTVGVYRSYDAGNSWDYVNGTEIVSYQGWYAKGLWIHSADTSRIMFGGVQVFRSDDNANNILRVSNNGFPNDYMHVDIHDIVGNPLNPDMIYVLSDGGLIRSNDVGDTYFECTEGYITSQFYIGALSATDPNIMLAGAQDNYTNRFDGTLYWTPDYWGDGSFCAINPDDDYIQYSSYQYLNIRRSDDRGFNWYQIFSHASGATGLNTAAFIAPYVLCNANTSVMYAAADTLYRSNDGGFNWYPTSGEIDNGNLPLCVTVSHTNVDSLYLATAPSDSWPMHAFRSVDGGATFTDISSGLPNRFPRDISVNPMNSQEVYVVFSGFGPGHVFKSTNSGDSWTDVSGLLPDVPFHSIEVLPHSPDTLFIGSDLGVFGSSDAGTSWYAFNLGLPYGAMVFDLRYSPQDNSLVAFTHGNGVYKVSLNDITTGTPMADFTKDFSQKIASNPVRDHLELHINSTANGFADFKIFDGSGKLIKVRTGNSLHAGRNRMIIDLPDLQSGTYFVRTELTETSAINKFILLTD